MSFGTFVVGREGITSPEGADRCSADALGAGYLCEGAPGSGGRRNDGPVASADSTR
jgi:hypothetical protein